MPTSIPGASELQPYAEAVERASQRRLRIEFVNDWREGESTLTPSGTQVYNLAFHDFPTGLRIFERIHLTMVDGRPIVDRELLKLTGCP